MAESAAERGFRRADLVGTRSLVNSEVYPEKLAARGIECVRPSTVNRAEINRIIMEALVRGLFKPAAIATHQRVNGKRSVDPVLSSLR